MYLFIFIIRLYAIIIFHPYFIEQEMPQMMILSLYLLLKFLKRTKCLALLFQPSHQ
jgi:hypothetical protein